jgi:uncharacterized protein YjbI with pentapeptide repeats
MFAPWASVPLRWCRLGVQIPVALALILCGTGASAAGAAEVPQGPVAVQAKELVARVVKDELIDLQGVVIEGDLDLRTVERVKRPLRCQKCQLRGSFIATMVVFDRLVDLSASTIDGSLDLEGAVFKEQLSFDEAYLGDAALASARFLSNVSFTRTTFLDEVVFDHAHAAGSFDFANATLKSAASFEGTEVEGRADFTLANFQSFATFRGAEFRGGASLRVARFDAGASFDQVRAGGLLDFGGASFGGPASSFDNLSASGAVSLIGIRVEGGELFIEQLAVPNLSMDVGTIDAVHGFRPQQRLLKLIEQSAESRDDLALANDARFQFLTLESERNRQPVRRLLDAVFYQGIAGYLVRPSHPLVISVFLIVAATLIRVIPRLWSKGVGRFHHRHELRRNPQELSLFERLHRKVLGSEKAATLVLSGLVESLATAFRTKPSIQVTDTERVRDYLLAGTRWMEFLLYKILTAIFLIGLGNSNATVRQILDAVRR